MHAKIELREVETERAGAGAEICQATVRHPLAPVGTQQRVEIVEIRQQRRSVGVRIVTEPLPDRDEHGAERLVAAVELGHLADHRRRHPPRRAERP